METPYIELLINVPNALVDCIKRACDAEAGIAWLVHGTPPDPESAGGLNPERDYLKEIGKNENSRWLMWGVQESASDDDEETGEIPETESGGRFDRYESDEEDVREFTSDTEVNIGATAWNPETVDQLAFRSCWATFVAMPDQSKEDDYEGNVPAGSYYGLTQTTHDAQHTYHGLYRLGTELTINDTFSTDPTERVWLNGAAERLLAKALGA